MIWWKSSTNARLIHCVAWLLVSLGLVSCGNQPSIPSAVEQGAASLSLQSQESGAPSPAPPLMAGATGLKPLPTVQQVQGAVPSGRADPFSLLPVPQPQQISPHLVVPVCWVSSLLAWKRGRCSPSGRVVVRSVLVLAGTVLQTIPTSCLRVGRC